jgi:hypothetical protein
MPTAQVRFLPNAATNCAPLAPLSAIRWWSAGCGPLGNPLRLHPRHHSSGEHLLSLINDISMSKIEPAPAVEEVINNRWHARLIRPRTVEHGLT